MPRSDKHSLLSRRHAITGTGAILGLGGVYGLSQSSEAKTEIESETNLEDASVTLDTGGNVEAVRLTGTVGFSYESPDTPIREVGAVANLTWHGSNKEDAPDGDAASGNSFEREQRTIKPPAQRHSGTWGTTFNDLSVIENIDNLEPADFEPEPGETIEHAFQLVASASIYENEDDSRQDALETVASEDRGKVVVERKQNNDNGENNDQEPVVVLTNSEFFFTVETES